MIDIVVSIIGDAAVTTLLAITLGLTAMVAGGRLYHFATLSIYTVGAYGLLFTVEAMGGAWIWLGLLLGISAGVILGLLIEVSVYRPLRPLSGDSTVLLVASLGVMVAVENCVAIVFGSETRFLATVIEADGFSVGRSHIGVGRGLLILTALVSVGALHAMLRYLSLGLCLRAVMADPWLAKTKGLRRDRLALAATVIASACAACAGMYAVIDWGASPWMGFRVLLYAVVCVVISGPARVVTLAFVAVSLSAISHVVAIRFPGNWQDVIVFSILVVWLISGMGPPRRA